jgi:ATP-binding cassette subfamily B protein
MKMINLREYSKIFKFIKPNKFFYFFILAMDCLIEISFYLLTPIVMKLMIDAAVKSNMRLLKSGVLLTLAVSVTAMILFVIVEFFLFRSFETTTANISKKLFSKILRLPVAYVEQNHSGDTISRLTNDIQAMEGSYSWPFRMILVSLISGTGSALVMFILDWKVSIILISIGAVSVLINSRQTKAVKKINDDIQKNSGRYTESLSNMVGGFMTIKSIQFEEHMLDRAYEINKDIYNSGISLAKKSSLTESITYVFNQINFIGVIILASLLASSGLSNLGSVVSMVFLLGHVNRMFEGISSMLIQIQGFTAGFGRVSELMETASEPDRIEIDPVENSKAMIDMRDIVFSYDSKNIVLDGISLSVEEGRIAALVGPSGCGKSTIFKMILGYYQPSSGKMSINRRPLNSMKMDELRSLVAYVPQDAYIFDGTIEENIRYGRLDAAKQEIIAAAKAACADEFICELENGYDTLVGEMGVKLSGGQRQRIAIARAFLKNAPILLLDEATSSLDSQSEMHIQEALNKLMKGKTVLIIAHRLSTVLHADVIYAIENGKVADSGTHEYLMLQCELYKNLYTTNLS